jgi:hypothetical protein
MHAAVMDLEAHKQLEAAKVELRNHLVLDGIDAGYTIREVARAAHVVRSRITQIISECG